VRCVRATDPMSTNYCYSCARIVHVCVLDDDKSFFASNKPLRARSKFAGETELALVVRVTLNTRRKRSREDAIVIVAVSSVLGGPSVYGKILYTNGVRAFSIVFLFTRCVYPPDVRRGRFSYVNALKVLTRVHFLYAHARLKTVDKINK